MTRPRRNARPLLLGHRGARALKSIPENTTASFDRALADGCDGFEFDVRLSADGEPVVCHDPQTGGIEIARASGEQLAALPQLQDVLARYQTRAFLDVELKVLGLEKITAALLRKSPPRRGFVVSSFLPEVLWAVHAEDSAIPLGLICETKAELSLWRTLPIEYVIPHHKLADAALIRKIRTAGKRMFVWTVNAPADMRRFAESGVDGIISDDTGLLHRLLTD
ncbi:MAG TPA: glycerophosphodiester phosphodiesterase [Candidatus Sulfotelmatobacter sp.]|jgi:glycerophosphoryl diester phosphodiesterase